MAEDLYTGITTAATAFTVIGLAELGDKTQLVCMTLAARYRGWPVFWGATVAFVVLNLLAVLFGAAVAAWLSPQLLGVIVAALFAGFGVHALFTAPESESTDIATPSSSLFITAATLIFLAEMGDKTQIAVAGFASTAAPIAVWLGATLGLIAISGLAVVAGRTVLQRIPLALLHRISGVLFLLLAAWVLWRVM